MPPKFKKWVIVNEKNEFYATKIDGEWGPGWGDEAEMFSTYEEALTIYERLINFGYCCIYFVTGELR